MKYKALKEQFNQSLEEIYHEQESSGLFYMALQKVAGSTRMQFLEQQQQEVAPQIMDTMLSLLEDLCAGKPIQYIFEEAWFYKLRFKVNANVLIPRDETEELVDLIIRTERGKGLQKGRLLDIGTGSGCIAIALKKNLPLFDVSALDVSDGALAVAIENAKSNDVSVTFILGDILTYSSPHQYDIIVSNPPYVKNDERSDMHQNVLDYEPHTALFVSDDDPLVFYRAIADFALHNLVKGGRLYFEINEYLGREMVALMEAKDFSDIQLIHDLQQKSRMLSCVR